MAEGDFLEAKPKRTRTAESIAKQKATRAAKKETVASPPPGKPSPMNLKTGLDADSIAEMEYARKLAEAEARIKEGAIPEDNRLMVLQEIKVDMFTTHRRYVELTPSMCDVRNCSFDAAREVGCAGWGEAPVDQQMADGRTFGQRLIDMKEYHKATAHTIQAQNDHIITASELHRRQWAPGNKVKGDFLK